MRQTRARRQVAAAGTAALAALVAGSLLPAAAAPAVTATATPGAVAPAAARPICTVPVLRRPVVNPLTGVPTRVLGPTVAVKVSNTVTRSANSRPQSGLNSADQVWVQEVEAGRTRFMPVYSSQYPIKVGPVRSGRETDLELLPAFGRAGIAYAGSAPPVQSLFVQASSQRRILDLGKSAKVAGRPIRDGSAAMRLNPRNTYYFDPSRASTVDFYVNTCALRTWAALGRATTPRNVGFAFSPTLSPGWKRASYIDARWSVSSTSRFVYNRKSGRYLIYWDGLTSRKLMLDRETRAPLATDNVVVMRVRTSPSQYVDEPLPSGVTLQVPISHTVGSGVVHVLRNGVRYSGTWSRRNATSPFQLRDARGRVIALKPGRTWIALVPVGAAFSGVPGDTHAVTAG